MGKSRTRKSKAQTKPLSEFLREMNERERRLQERRAAENIPEPIPYPPEFFEFYGDPLNVSSLENIAWRQRWNARLYPNDPRHFRGTSANQKRKLALHREKLFPALHNIYTRGRTKRQRNKIRESRAQLVEELQYLPPIPEVGFPGGNIYREAEEEWKSLQ